MTPNRRVTWQAISNDEATLGGAAAAWPLAARAQQQSTPVVGFLSPTPAEGYEPVVVGFRQGLSEIGFVEGKNVAIDYRWANGQFNRLPGLAADLVRRQVDAMAAAAPAAALAAKAATTTIPIIFAVGADPVKFGLVASLNRPGGNITGVIIFTNALVAKRLELLRELVPNAGKIGLLVNPNNPDSQTQVSDVQGAANSFGLQLLVLNAGDERAIEMAFAELRQHLGGALLVGSDSYFFARRDRILELAARHAIPAIYDRREYVAAGGLISYGSNIIDSLRQVGIYTGRILKGEKPADLPVQAPNRYELVINLRTAKALGIDVPPMLLARADEVIE
jgi:ABC-type uncharacterized transport system substrate-binding protein